MTFAYAHALSAFASCLAFERKDAAKFLVIINLSDGILINNETLKASKYVALT